MSLTKIYSGSFSFCIICINHSSGWNNCWLTWIFPKRNTTVKWHKLLQYQGRQHGFIIISLLSQYKKNGSIIPVNTVSWQDEWFDYTSHHLFRAIKRDHHASHFCLIVGGMGQLHSLLLTRCRNNMSSILVQTVSWQDEWVHYTSHHNFGLEEWVHYTSHHCLTARIMGPLY